MFSAIHFCAVRLHCSVPQDRNYTTCLYLYNASKAGAGSGLKPGGQIDTTRPSLTWEETRRDSKRTRVENGKKFIFDHADAKLLYIPLDFGIKKPSVKVKHPYSFLL